MALSDYRYALEFRSELQRLVREEVERQRPRYQMATVVSIDRTNRKCVVTFPGDTTNATVSMGSVQPTSAGQVVRVEGLAGDRYISDVMGPAYEPVLDASNITFTGNNINFNGSIGFNDGLYLNNSLTTLDGFKGKAWNQLSYLQRCIQMQGGGLRFVTSTGISWNSRIIAMGFGKDTHVAPSGYFDITMPPDGTVVTGHGGMTSVTVASGEIPLQAWAALYYDLPLGATATSQNANFHIVGYTSDYIVPDTWVLLAVRHWETALGTIGVYWWDGREQDYWRAPTFLNSWVNYNTANYLGARYRREGGVVTVEGLIASGTISATSTGNAFILPAGYRPSGTMIFGTASSAGTQSSIYVYSTGDVRIVSGSTSWTSLNNIRFRAEN